MNMHVLVHRFVIELRIFANVVQTRANEISGIPTSGFEYLKGACKCGNTSGEVGYRQKRTNTEETSGNGGYPDDPPPSVQFT